MPRLTRSVPTYRKHRASGQAIVTLGGRDFYLGPYGTKTSKNEYDRLVGEWLQQGRQFGRQHAGQTCGSRELSIVELIVAYLHFAKRYYRKHGRSTSEYPAIVYALRFVKQLYGGKSVSEFGPIALQTVMQKMVEAGWARRNINKQAGRIKRMFRWGVSQELIPGSIPEAIQCVDGLRKGRTEARETAAIRPVNAATVEATLAHVPEAVADMARLQMLSGMRPAEVCMLRPMDIDRSEDVWVYRPDSHKTEHHERDRVVFIGPRAQGILLKYSARDPAACCFRPCDSEAKRRAVQHAARVVPLHYGNRPGTNRRARPKRSVGERYDVGAYRRAIHRGCDKAFLHPTLSTIPKSELVASQREQLRRWQSDHRWSPNRLRHSAATKIRKEFGLEASQVILGHASAITSEIYAERDATKGIEVAQKIG